MVVDGGDRRHRVPRCTMPIDPLCHGCPDVQPRPGRSRAALRYREPVHEAKVVTVSDSVSTGDREDRTGPGSSRSSRAAGSRCRPVRVVPDGVDSVAGALRSLSDGFHGLIVTAGGTGFSPGDLTPEGTRAVLDRLAPGLAEAMRAANPLGRLSRGVAGTLGASLIVNLPGSPHGAVECLEAIVDVVPHALDLLGGQRPH